MTRSIFFAVLALAIFQSCLGELATLPISTFQLKLTINNSQRNLLRGGNNNNNNNNKNDHRRLEEESIEDTIRPIAESHLTKIYTREFSNIPPPSQVLLTVVTSDNNNNNNDNNDNSEVGGFYIRSSFLGGVVSFPTSSDRAPSRAQLERITIAAFQVPGDGEPFLASLVEEDHPQLKGLLLIGAVELDTNYNDDRYTSDAGPSSSLTSDSSSATQLDEDRDRDPNLNIWAVAAVAALGAMFLVIVTCTSILYCDWRKRKNRRERKRERAMAQAQHAAVSGGGGNGGSGSNGKPNYRNKGNTAAMSNKSSNGGKSVEEAGQYDVKDPPQIRLQGEALQIVVPSTSGETEHTPSPSTTHGSNEKEEFDRMLGSTNNNNISNNNNNRGSMFQKMRSSSRRIPKVKSKAATSQLQDATAMDDSNFANQNATTNGNNNNNNSSDYIPEMSPSVTDHSVGDDTTMLYPTINRHRLGSKDRSADNMSDFDGYSMDGMSAIVGVAGDGFSAYSGSGHGGSQDNSNGGRGSGLLRKRDVMYSGDVPRDFDSVWGEDDQSKMTMDGSIDNNTSAYLPSSSAKNGKVKDVDKEAYRDLARNLDELVEHEYEESSQSNVGSIVGSAAGDPLSASANLHEFDSGSESGSNKGAFTLELLGKGPSAKARKGNDLGGSSSAPSQDDEDSILGDMYRDETTSDDDESATGASGIEKVPSGGDSVDSTPSWAAPIQSALRNSANIFRTSSTSPRGEDDDKENNTSNKTLNKEENDNGSVTSSTSMKESQEQRTKEKFVSSLSNSSKGSSGDEGSVNSNISGGSNNSKGESNITNSNTGGIGTQKGASLSRKQTTAKSVDDKALGLTNSMEDEVDEDPAAMIDNINSMLSECRDILDTEKTM